MNYTDNPGMVRVDYFKPSGKWYMTEARDMSGFYHEPLVQDAVRLALQRDGRWLTNFTIVVMNPYHHSGGVPVMFPAEVTEDE